MKPQPDPRYSHSLEHGIAILECFSAAGPALQISELADMILLSRSTTHRYAKTLVALQRLEQDQQRRYFLSRASARPGMTIIDTLRMETPAARRILEDLREQTGHTVSMGTLDGAYAIYLHRFFAHGAGQYEADRQLGVGAHVPAYCTAIGKALLADLGRQQQRAVLASLTLEREGPNTIMSKRALAEELAHVRATGIAVCDEEQAPGVRSIATAIPNPGHSKPLAVSLTVPAQRLSLKAMTDILGPYVKAAAQRI